MKSLRLPFSVFAFTLSLLAASGAGTLVNGGGQWRVKHLKVESAVRSVLEAELALTKKR